MLVPVLNLPSAHVAHCVSSLSFVELLPGAKNLASSHVVALALQDVAASLYSPSWQVVQVASSLSLTLLSPAVKYSSVEQSVCVFLSWQDWAVLAPVLNLPSAHVVHWVSSLSFVESLPGVKNLASPHVVALALQDVAVSLYSPFWQVVQVVSSLSLTVLSPAAKYFSVEQSVCVFLSWQDWAVLVPVLNLPSAPVVPWVSSLSFVESLPGVKYVNFARGILCLGGFLPEFQVELSGSLDQRQTAAFSLEPGPRSFAGLALSHGLALLRGWRWCFGRGGSGGRTDAK